MRGGKWSVGLHIARSFIDQGAKTAASPDGRLSGAQLSKNASASSGNAKEGATAAVLSVTKLNAVHMRVDASVDLALLPSAVSGEDGLTAMLGLLKTFIRRGGHAMHINVFDSSILKDAQQHPEDYRDL